ncbi:MAG: hypothetical protein U0Q11_25200 [Vicinamibacterales bacterium]
MSRNPSKELDRGASVVQGVDELKTLRDRFVHPKVRRADWTPVNDTTLTVDFGSSKALGLPFDTGVWRPHESIVALRAAVDFYNYFFLELCELNSNQTCEILVGDGPVDLNNVAGYQMDGMGDLKAAADKWHLSFRFLGFQ